MKCEVCNSEILERKNSVVCSDKCSKIRLLVYGIIQKHKPTNGCDNCWGDLHQGCSEQCKKESKEAFELAKDLWSLVRLIYSEKL